MDVSTQKHPVFGSPLQSLRDLAQNDAVWQLAQAEQVTQTSLLRSVSVSMVEVQFRRILAGLPKLTPFDFKFILNFPNAATITLNFTVTPGSHPPTNVHVLIGRNGVGKTRTLKTMADALLGDDRAGKFDWRPLPPPDYGNFTHLVTVTFSAFDEFLPQTSTATIRHSYIGLRNSDNSPTAPTVSSIDSLSAKFVTSIKECRDGSRARRWRRAMTTLESDPIFQELDASKWLELAEFDLTTRFALLSSGHKLVLLTTTQLVEKVEERTLILFDEPEAHLHPPLLASFVKAISDLLIDRNGVAIIATHSPVVLQEIPSSCAWVMRRVGSVANVERPSLETFGGNVGVLTREVFQLEVTQSGFHKLLTDAAASSLTYEAALNAFGGQIGGEGRAILRANYSAKEHDDNAKTSNAV